MVDCRFSVNYNIPHFSRKESENREKPANRWGCLHDPPEKTAERREKTADRRAKTADRRAKTWFAAAGFSRLLPKGAKMMEKDENRLDFYMFEDIFTKKPEKPSYPMNQPPEKKKTFIMFPSVKDFMREQSGDVKKELNGIVFLLERDGTLSYPYAEKVQGEDLFAIRVIQAGNIRIFYVYGVDDRVYAVHGYVKKTQEIPHREMAIARKALKWLIQKGLVL